MVSGVYLMHISIRYRTFLLVFYHILIENLGKKHVLKHFDYILTDSRHLKYA